MMEHTHLYKHYNAGNELLYIGISGSAAERLKRHSTEWRDTVARSEITVFKTREAALEAEKTAIQTETPKFNVVHLAQSDRRHQHDMDSKEYRETIVRLGLTQAGAAEYLGISLRTSNAYANGTLIPRAIAMLLRICLLVEKSPSSKELHSEILKVLNQAD